MKVIDVLYKTIFDSIKEKTDLSIIEHTGEHNIDITCNGINKYSTLKKYFSDQYY